MQTVELSKREIEVILALLRNCEGGPMRLGNNNITVSLFDDIDPMIKRFSNMLCRCEAGEE